MLAETDVVLILFLVIPTDSVASNGFLPNRSGFTRIRPRILHSVVGSLFARHRGKYTDFEGGGGTQFLFVRYIKSIVCEARQWLP
jgi:hypothetical protein